MLPHPEQPVNLKIDIDQLVDEREAPYTLFWKTRVIVVDTCAYRRIYWNELNHWE